MTIRVKLALFLLGLLINFETTTSNEVQAEPNAMEIIGRVNQIHKQGGGITLRELDIVPAPPVATAAGHGEFSAAFRQGYGRLWRNGIIPYTTSEAIRKRPKHIAAIQAAMEEWERATCVKFVERSNTSRRFLQYVRITFGIGCYASLGRPRFGRPSTLSLGAGCQWLSVAAHELGHVMGFSHEHNRPDRDNYIAILWENVKQNNLSPFRSRLSRRYMDDYGVPYDYRSIMHYHSREFSKNGLRTIKARNPSIISFGNARPSALDIQQINFMYNCQVYPKFPTDFTLRTTPDQTKNCILLNQTRDPNWGTRYLCFKPTIKKMNITWSQNGRIGGMECVNTKMPHERTWHYWSRTYLCVPRDELYRFYWSAHGPVGGSGCLKFRDNRYGGYQLCATKRHADVDGGWSPWSSWQQCDRKCGGGVQTRLRQCNNPTPANGGKTCRGASYETRSCNQDNCPDWPHWPSDFRFLQQNFAPAGFTCVRVYERQHFRHWRRVVLCWVKWKKPLTFKWSDVGAVSGMRCTRITEQAASGWDNNYLCTGGDYPYEFRWSSRGPIKGLRCLQWLPEISRPGWNDNYLCAREFPQPTKAPTTGCYASWSTFQVGNTHHCYIRVLKKVTWEDAQRECRELKAELVSIGSEAEYEFIMRELHDGQSAWIGLNDKQREGQWMWTDTTPLNFTKWDRGEPTPDDRRENCAMSNVYSSKWNDYPCTSKFPFMCKSRGRTV